ncbi:HD domain-containing protein [Candidatus Nomurabacteria bacterium]|nr:HD domain-containing protein [Candidatus Nomurabacteria bacterium]
MNKVPTYVIEVIKTLKNKGFEAYLVGGCVRDLLIDRVPKDWDITTNAKPEDITSCFEKTVYENNFGTVSVFIPKDDETYEMVEVTPYRLEGKYTDKRHPDNVSFSDKLEDDLSRRDFTINAIAYSPDIEIPDDISKGQLIDLYKGQEDIKDKTIRTVGGAKERFSEDALRIVRAIRFSTELGFTVSQETFDAIIDLSGTIKDISKERIRDEFTKIIMSDKPEVGIMLLEKTNLLEHIVPELLEGVDCEQGGAHKYDVFRHLVEALSHASQKNWPLDIRLSALFHDIGKPRTKRQPKGWGRKPTFYGHEVVGARMANKIMENLKFPKDLTEKVTKMVRYHMFFSDTEKISLSAVRRIVKNVGVENIWDLMKVRECDRVGMAKTEAPYRLRKYHAMIEEVLRDPISVKQLKIDGEYMIKELGMNPGPRMGWILHALLEEVLDDPNKNDIDYLVKRIEGFEKMNDDELKALGEKAKLQKDILEENEITRLHQKHSVSNKK